MTLSHQARFATVVGAFALVACSRSTKVSSPAPAATPAPAAAPAPMSMAAGLPAGVTGAMVEEGKALYAGASCVRCHGPAGAGANNGPSLTDATWVQNDGSYAAIVKTIHDGVPKASVKGTFPFAMRPMGGGNFTEAQVQSIAAYVYSISHK